MCGGRGGECVTYLCDIFWLHGHSLRHGHVACVCVSAIDRERECDEKECGQLLIFPFSPLTFPHFAALSCLNATCSRCCARTFMHHLPLPGVRVFVCVPYVACVAASGNCFVICVARGKAQRAKLQADNCQTAEKSERESERRNPSEGSGRTGKLHFALVSLSAQPQSMQHKQRCNIRQKICIFICVQPRGA